MTDAATHRKGVPPGLISIIIAVSTAQFLLPFMVAGVIPLLPMIGADLSAGAMELGLVGAIYSLSLSLFHLVSGRIGDMMGRRRLFLTGLSIFLIMSVCTALSPNMVFFLACRFLQAVGTAMMNTSALAILITVAPPHMRGRVLGTASIGLFAGISLGPVLGGVIGSLFGWRYLFLAVVPVGLVAWCLMAFTVKGDWTSDPDAPFDWKGTVLYSLGITAISLGATWILSGAWAVFLCAAGGVLLLLFALVERHQDHPILDVGFLVHNSAFSLNVIICFIMSASVFGLQFYYSLYLQGVLNLSVMTTGLVLALQPAVQLVVAPLAGRLADRLGSVQVAAGGLVMCCLGLFMVYRLGTVSELWEVFAAQIGLGLGLALFAAPNTSAVMGAVDMAHLSQASGLLGTMRTMGMLASMVAVSVTMNIYLGLDPLSADNTSAFLAAMHANITLFQCLNALGIGLSLWQLRKIFRRYS